MNPRIAFPVLILAIVATAALAQQKKKAGPPALKWRVQQLHKDNNEGLAVGDIDGNGTPDVTAGEYWYPSPEFKKLPVRKLMPFGADYLQNNSEHLFDVDSDGDLDVVSGAFTLSVVNWFENPGQGNYSDTGTWKSHVLVDTGTGKNEATFLHDLDGDGTPEWLENSWDAANPMIAWRLVKGEDGVFTAQQHTISESGNGHGMGFGDVNGDGKEDIVFNQGWYECPADGPFSGPWQWRKDFDLPHASCPVLVLDLNGDGRSDIVWADGHNYGLYWEEQLEPQSDGMTTWRQHLIDKKFSQGHCLAWEDLDQDGAPELITGKRYYAHSGKDPGAEDPITIQYYDWDAKTGAWTKNLISQAPAGEGPGIGLQIRTADFDKNGWLDIAVPGKSGTHILWNEGWTANQ